MQKLLFLIAFTISFSAVCFSQQLIKPEDAGKHVGDSVTVCGKIYGGKYLESAKNQPTFLNLGAAYPDQLLTVVIWGDMRKQLKYIPEEKFKDQTICVIGRIEEFNGKPQIVINKANQLQED